MKDSIKERDLLNQCNRTLRGFGLCIKRSFCEATNETYYVLVNEISDTITYQNIWSRNENVYFFAVLNGIISRFLNNQDDSEDNVNPYDSLSIGSTQATNLSRTANISMVLSEKLIKNWINLHWLEKSGDGNITLGIRSLTEFSGYFIEKFNLSKCFNCHLVCPIGRFCEQCNIALHKHCCLGDNQNSEFNCSGCNNPMSDIQKIVPLNR